MVAFTLSLDTGAVMRKFGITRKQYYLKMNRLIDAGLVTKKRSIYFLTSFGKVVYQSNLLIGQAVENYWKLKAIDSLESTISYNDLSAEERKKLIDTLIKSSSIKNILLEYNVALDASSGPHKVRVISETPVAC